MGANCMNECVGVMRFLQTEWHKHERDRNSWEIERAEMKARIAKMEGENRAARRLQQGLMTRIKMLETALKKKGVEEGKVQNSEGSLANLKCRLGSGMGVPMDGWTDGVSADCGMGRQHHHHPGLRRTYTPLPIRWRCIGPRLRETKIEGTWRSAYRRSPTY